MMQNRMQLSPPSDSRESSVSLIDLSAAPPANVEGMMFFRLRVVYEPRLNTERRLNWNAVLGLGLATAVSVSIWAGIALAVAHIWK